MWDQIVSVPDHCLSFHFDTKLKVHKAVVLPALLYACETCTVYQRHAKRRNHFDLFCLRKLLRSGGKTRSRTQRSWKGWGCNAHTLLKLAQLRWTGHVTRMPDKRLPKKVFYGELQVGKRSQGGQTKRYKDTHKASLNDFNIPPESWEQIELDRAKWRCLISNGTDEYEAKRISESERNHKKRKARAKGSSSESSFSELACSICCRQFRAKLA